MQILAGRRVLFRLKSQTQMNFICPQDFVRQTFWIFFGKFQISSLKKEKRLHVMRFLRRYEKVSCTKPEKTNGLLVVVILMTILRNFLNLDFIFETLSKRGKAFLF